MSDEPKQDEHKADAHSSDAHGSHSSDSHGSAHGSDAHADDHGHGHGHDDHAVPADAIKEGSVYDTVLSGLALLVGLALVGLIVYWCGLKPAVVAEGEPGAHHEAQHEAPANSEPAPVH
ncbi:MAG: hypothetical protein JST89_20870 [Cyanobacteria bacterium SZAS-4]|nr:hypothetical protein [Cyanobacteria bacterium SZAS-4]